MRPVSQLLRGRFYSTHLTVRCPYYHRCTVCGACRRYDRNQLACRVCELERMAPHCHCKPSTLNAMRLITRKLGYEIAHPDMPRTATITTLEEDAEMLEFINRNIGRVKEVDG